MKFITGKDRNQTEFFCLEQAIGQENEVRLIDLFVNSLNISDFGFKLDFIENGRPAYHPTDLLKLYIYGYLNRTRSSRALEKECSRNIEVMWLMRGLIPDHNTIANFRKDNPKAIQKVFRATVQLAKHFELIGGKLIAGDSTKLRAQNSKKNNFNPGKLERHIAYIDARLEEYNQTLAAQDFDKTDEQKQAIIKKVQKHQAQKQKYEQMQQQIINTDVTQISTSDPDSRQLITRNNITEVAYNVQTTVDEKHNLLIDYKITNENDSKAMGAMVRRAKTILKTNEFIGLYDKGYHTGTEFSYANQQGVEVMVAIPAVASHAPDIAFDIEHFQYNKEKDQYTCPAGESLITNGNWYNKKQGKTINKVKHYKTKACLTCSFFERCTKNKEGRLIERSEHADLIDDNKVRINQNPELYRKRQAIVEHPYGIIKRQWDFYYIMTKKTIHHANADVGLIFTAFNLRRIINIIDQKMLKEYLKAFALFFALLTTFFKRFSSILSQLKFNIKISINNYLKPLESIYLNHKNQIKIGY
jgi:transposase